MMIENIQSKIDIKAKPKGAMKFNGMVTRE